MAVCITTMVDSVSSNVRQACFCVTRFLLEEVYTFGKSSQANVSTRQGSGVREYGGTLAFGDNYNNPSQPSPRQTHYTAVYCPIL